MPPYPKQHAFLTSGVSPASISKFIILYKQEKKKKPYLLLSKWSRGARGEGRRGEEGREKSGVEKNV